MNSTTKTATILVVDDDPLHLHLVTRVLARAGFATVPASNGEEAIERMNAAQFDAVVTDVMMPRMNGLELLQSIRGRLPWLPVILMSGNVEENTRATASALGAAAVFQKPMNRRELILALRTALADAAPPFASVLAAPETEVANISNRVLNQVA